MFSLGYGFDELSYCFGVGFGSAVGESVLAGSMDFGDACFLYNMTGIIGGDTCTGHDEDTAMGVLNKGTDGRDACLGVGLAARGEQTVATAANDGLKGFNRRLAHLVEGTVESHLHRSSQLDDMASALFVDQAVGSEEAYDNSMDTTLAA